MRVQLTIILDLDAKSEEEALKIIQEMDYDFSYIEMEEEIGKHLIEKELIVFKEITDLTIL